MVSPLWLGSFLYGPLEWLWQSLAYWRVQPFRRPTVAALSAAVLLLVVAFAASGWWAADEMREQVQKTTLAKREIASIEEKT